MGIPGKVVCGRWRDVCSGNGDGVFILGQGILIRCGRGGGSGPHGVGGRRAGGRGIEVML